jgi:hypothetical protein
MAGRPANRIRAALACSLALLLASVAAACSDDGGTGASGSTLGEPTTTSLPPTTTTSEGAATTSGAGCASATRGGLPSGVASRTFGDVDGDGAPDVLYVGVDQGASLRRFGVVTASGIRSEWTVDNASPVAPAVLGVADADEDGQVEIFVNPGRVVDVLTFRDCTLQPYLNREGEPYGFSVGFDDTGTGMGCVDADGDGRRELVGLTAGERSGDQVPWTRTIVELSGNQARNGATSSGTYTSPRDDAAIELLHRITCGDDAFSSPLTGEP